MPRKLIFFDIDGTLLDHEKQIPPSTRQAVEQLKEAGHELIIATGRGPFMSRDIMDSLGIASSISFNGSYVVYKGEVLHSLTLDPDRLHELAVAAVANRHPIVYMAPDGMRTSDSDNAYESTASENEMIRLPAKDGDYYKGRDIFQCLLCCTEEHEHYYKERFPEFVYNRWHRYGSDIIPPGGSKARGIQAVIEKAGFRQEDVYAFGDGLNDIEMLEYVHHSVAMGNAPDVVKQAAKYVTRDVTDDGIWHGLRLVGLL
ncbi:Cof-type HAD-IIB family hydrolase [Paenibacillus sp. NPDC058071]|uniref:Cof-type HAD-IIB family hydrolase n=1 Tax=Paenibacillus sp. NPDC058071 TaxID=3346326 RepID=UPI0036DECEC2